MSDASVFAYRIGERLGRGHSAIVDDDGNFKLTGLSPPAYILFARAPGYVFDDPPIGENIHRIGEHVTIRMVKGGVIKPGEKISGVEVIVAEDAATLNGNVVQARDGAKLPSWLRAHLIPAEEASADDALRYAETDVRADGSFDFKHVAPGKYLLHARRIVGKDANDEQARPVAWDPVGRADLRREAMVAKEAMAAKNEIELQPCGRVKDYALKWR